MSGFLNVRLRTFKTYSHFWRMSQLGRLPSFREFLYRISLYGNSRPTPALHGWPMNGRSAAELAVHTRQSVLTLSATTVIRAVGDRNPKLPVL